MLSQPHSGSESQSLDPHSYLFYLFSSRCSYQEWKPQSQAWGLDIWDINIFLMCLKLPQGQVGVDLTTSVSDAAQAKVLGSLSLHSYPYHTHEKTKLEGI